MKKRKIFYLFPIVSILLTGCTFQEGWDSVKTWFNDKVLSIFNKNSGGSSKGGGGSGIGPGDVTPEDTKTHATSIDYTNNYPSAPFYLKLGDTQTLSVSLSPSKDVDPNEKLFKWELNGDNVTCDLSTEANKIDITGAKVGTCTMKVTNTYNVSLFKTYTIKVIDFDESKDYLWQYYSGTDRSDRAEFGFISKTREQGLPSGEANLGGMTWSYSRKDKDGNDLATSLQSSMSSVGFGKGKEPETHLHFEAENAREVSKITIEAGSARSLAKMTIKVGDVVYMDNETVPYPSWDVIPTMPVAEGSSSGKIEIDVVTPDYDPDQSQNPEYQVPGAFYLKSIWINFKDKLPDKTLTLVKDASEIEDGARYLIVGKPKKTEAYYCLNGSITTSVKDNPKVLEDFEFGDTYTLAATEVNLGFVAAISDGLLYLEADNSVKIGMTNKGNLSVKTATPDRTGWNYSVTADGNTDLSMDIVNEETSVTTTMHLGITDTGSQFGLYDDVERVKAIYFYKFN